MEFKKPQLDELVNTAESLKTDANKLQLQTKGKVHVSILLFMFFVFGRLEDFHNFIIKSPDVCSER